MAYDDGILRMGYGFPGYKTERPALKITKKRKKKPTKKVDPKYMGIPNICFSLTKPDDNREKKFKKQRMTRGFDTSETWSLRDTIGAFTLPRLKVFAEIAKDTFRKDSYEKYFADLDAAIVAFELLVRDNGSFMMTPKELKLYNKGMRAYHRIFLGLWW